MKKSTENILMNLLKNYPSLADIKDEIFKACEKWIYCFERGGKLLICGNGGSASDSLHIVGELMKDFVKKRKIPQEDIDAIKRNSDNADYICQNLQVAFPAIALIGSSALETAYSNDRAPDLAFAQQVYGYGKKDDILLAISTSGNSANVIYAASVAKAKEMTVIGLTGNGGGKLRKYSDILLNVPEKETYRIQELHLPVYHALCLATENEFFGD